MKNKGALAEFSEERARDLYEGYCVYIENCSHIDVKEAFASVVKKPARRFYVSETRASVVVSAIMRNKKPLVKMHPLKREMYEEIYRRVLKLKRLNPSMDLPTCCLRVVEQNAPQFYLAPGTAYAIVCKARKRWKKEMLKRALR